MAVPHAHAPQHGEEKENGRRRPRTTAQRSTEAATETAEATVEGGRVLASGPRSKLVPDPSEDVECPYRHKWGRG